jgi:hypothetical protein
MGVHTRFDAEEADDGCSAPLRGLPASTGVHTRFE